jgi:hypothetical protein
MPCPGRRYANHIKIFLYFPRSFKFDKITAIPFCLLPSEIFSHLPDLGARVFYLEVVGVRRQQVHHYREVLAEVFRSPCNDVEDGRWFI